MFLRLLLFLTFFASFWATAESNPDLKELSITSDLANRYSRLHGPKSEPNSYGREEREYIESKMGLTLKNTISDPTNGTTALVFYNHATKEIIVTFRATNTMNDVLVNLNFLPRRVRGEKATFRAHGGYARRYLTIKDEIRKSIEEIQNETNHQPKKVVFYGHSLGGAVGNIALTDQYYNHDLVPHGLEVKGVFLAAPRSVLLSKKEAKKMNNITNHYLRLDLLQMTFPWYKRPGKNTVLRKSKKNPFALLFGNHFLGRKKRRGFFPSVTFMPGNVDEASSNAVDEIGLPFEKNRPRDNPLGKNTQNQ